MDTSYYEVIRIINSIPIFIHEHIERLFNSISLANKRINISHAEIERSILLLISSNKIEIGNIKFQIQFTDTTNYRFLAYAIPFFYPSKETFDIGVDVITIDLQRQNPHQKVMNYELRKETEKQRSDNSVAEVIHLNKNLWITEGSKSNIFFLKDDLLLTSPASSVLPGITRQKVIEIAEANHIKFRESNIHLNEVPFLDGAFLTGTSIKILPIKRFNDIHLNVQNTLITKLAKLYNDMLNTYIDSSIHRT